MLRMFTPKKRNFLVIILLIFIFIYFYYYLYCSPFNLIWNKNSRLATSETTKNKNINYLQSALGQNIFNQIKSLNCSLILNDDKNYLNSIKTKRIVQRDLDDLDIDCNSIKNRWKFYQNFEEISAEEKEFPLAFARTVYRDYLMLEQMLSVEYAPHNVYCYSLDRKADKKFKERIRALSRCFSTNVFIADVEYNVYSSGKNVSRSHLSCLEELNKRKEDWKYVVLLQNHDLPLRTNAELVRIFKAYNGTNDIATKHIIKTSVDKSLDWSLKGLHLYRNEKAYPPNVKELYHTKSLNLITLTRAAVNFVLKELNVYPFIDQLEKSRYGMDEVLYSTLNSNLPDFPGGFTTECLKNQNKIVSSMGRYVIWRTHGKQTNRCMSDYLRHDVCVYGVEDLPHIARARLHFYLNKMMPSFDYGAIFCWLSTLAARRLSREIDINEKYYQQLPHVRYNNLKYSKQQKNISNEEQPFKC